MSARDGGEWSGSRSDRFIPGETDSGVYGIGSLLGPKTGFLVPAGNRTTGSSVIQPIAKLLNKFS
jgi:hypothetical protein